MITKYFYIIAFVGQFVSVASVIRDKMTDRQRDELRDCIMELAGSLIGITDAEILLQTLETNAAVRTYILNTVESFARQNYLRNINRVEQKHRLCI